MSTNNTKKSVIIDKSVSNEISLTPIIKSKYILANTVKTNKINSKLSKSVNNVISHQNFIGYDTTDYDNVQSFCSESNVNLFVKQKSQFADDIYCKKNIIANSQNFIGFSDSELSEVKSNINNNLLVKGNSLFYGNLSTHNISSKSINIGFEEISPEKSISTFNVNGESTFSGDNIIHGSAYINNNLMVSEQTVFYNDVFMSNSMYLKKEILKNITIDNNYISSNNYKFLLTNILTSIQNHTKPSSVFKFFSGKNNNFYSGLISATKQFIIEHSNTQITAFILVYGIYSHSKLLSVKPVLDTFILVDPSEQIIQIGEANIKNNSPIKNMSSSVETKSIIEPVINILTAKFKKIFKKSISNTDTSSTNSKNNLFST
jgi:hypothetical protein